MPTVTKKDLSKWTPFTYICEGFKGEKSEVGGVFPADVRAKCPIDIVKIHGPVVKGFGSWLMYQLVN